MEDKEIVLDNGYQGLFNFMVEEHGLVLTVCQMDDIVSESQKINGQSQDLKLTWKATLEKLREAGEAHKQAEKELIKNLPFQQGDPVFCNGEYGYVSRAMPSLEGEDVVIYYSVREFANKGRFGGPVIKATATEDILTHA
jgi:hypothetical protein